MINELLILVTSTLTLPNTAVEQQTQELTIVEAGTRRGIRIEDSNNLDMQLTGTRRGIRIEDSNNLDMQLTGTRRGIRL